MKAIELHEAYYRNGCYQSKPLIVNVDEIAAINEDRSGYQDFVIIHLKSGKSFALNDKYSDVRRLIEEAIVYGGS